MTASESNASPVWGGGSGRRPAPFGVHEEFAHSTERGRVDVGVAIYEHADFAGDSALLTGTWAISGTSAVRAPPATSPAAGGPTGTIASRR